MNKYLVHHPSYGAVAAENIEKAKEAAAKLCDKAINNTVPQKYVGIYKLVATAEQPRPPILVNDIVDEVD